jgi:cation/acetate symporter
VSISLAMFLVFVAGTLGITASRHSRCGRLLRCGRKITAWRKWIRRCRRLDERSIVSRSRRSHRLTGFRRIPLCRRRFVAFVTILLPIAEALRSSGKYTLGDVLAYRLRPRPVRAMTAINPLGFLAADNRDPRTGCGGEIQRADGPSPHRVGSREGGSTLRRRLVVNDNSEGSPTDPCPCTFARPWPHAR